MRKWLLLGLSLFLIGPLTGDEYPYLLVRKCTIKSENVNEYIELKKDWLTAYSQFTKGKNAPPIYAYEYLDQPVFAYLVGLQSLQDMDRFNKIKDSFTNTMTGKQLDNRENRHGKMNSISYSFERYIEECSHFPEGSGTDFTDYEYVAFFVYSIFPGTEKIFERYLQSLKENKKYATIAWQTWKVEIGDNLPKYIICLLGNSLDTIKKQNCKIDFLDPSQKNILREQYCGTSRLRKDLSYLQNQ
ncbi:MAG: hypothetical protein KDK59_06470 [Simkania sp.]|nr:hypothetical protein [Simkania sp.]